jgi:1,4-alpha-glucan branching enzyme
MTIVKKLLKNKPVCKVTFRLPRELARGARKVSLVGEFNNWNPKATPLEQLKSGEFKVTVDLEVGREYQYRYLLDGKVWQNDDGADRYCPSGFEGAENSVVRV